MGLGANVTEQQALATICSSGVPLPDVSSAATLAAAYYGWSFASDPTFTEWPFYPSAGSNECSS